MLREPINIVPGVYTKPGERAVMGLCIMIDSLDAQWEVTTSDHYEIVINIKKDAKWKVQEYADPKTGKQSLQIFREGAKLDRMAQEFINPTDEAFTQGDGAASGAGPALKIYYTTPEDGQTPPQKIKAS